MSTTQISGVTVATFFTLFIVPGAYRLIGRGGCL